MQAEAHTHDLLREAHELLAVPKKPGGSRPGSALGSRQSTSRGSARPASAAGSHTAIPHGPLLDGSGDASLPWPSSGLSSGLGSPTTRGASVQGLGPASFPEASLTNEEAALLSEALAE